ncbi:unnamed protein product, partial [Thelazia callipaeda]|uniref:Nuclear receptor domain-containing protein n=1 Tax=Thelazia callipaeda TaxID=103827 RepID=A0A0N5DA37_THECL
KGIQAITNISNRYNCGICLARATGYHFEAQSCSACAAFFRRAIVHRKVFSCKSGLNNCTVHYCMSYFCKIFMENFHFQSKVLERLVVEELKISERRRILFCERPLGSILGRSQPCPYTAEEIFPLRFRKFRKSIRTHILLVYEWLRSWPTYDTFSKFDQITFLRKCVLYHTILDPSYLTLQIGYPSRFIMQNGGFLAVDENCKEGWEDEKEISGATKQKQLMSEIVEPMAAMKMSLEEFVALKAFVSWKGNAMKKMLDALCKSLHQYYEHNNRSDLSERFGNIILLLSSVFATGAQFVESHHEVAFFDLWQLDSLLVQLLKCESD